MSDLVKKNERKFNLGDFVLDNIVTIIFWVFIILGLALAKSVTFNWFLTELSNRFYRNAFLVLSLIIPVIAGLGLNFGIVVGAIAGQLAIILVRYYYIGGFGGFLLCMLIALPIAMLFGWLTGTLYNKTRGQEMIASLIVGYFGTGIYMFIVLFLIGGVIPVQPDHPIILPGGVGIRMTVDMDTIKYALEGIWQIPICYIHGSGVCAGGAVPRMEPVHTQAEARPGPPKQLQVRAVRGDCRCDTCRICVSGRD